MSHLIALLQPKLNFSLLCMHAEFVYEKIYTNSAEIPAVVKFVSYLKFLNFTNILACKNTVIVLDIIFGRMYLEAEWVYPVHHW